MISVPPLRLPSIVDEQIPALFPEKMNLMRLCRRKAQNAKDVGQTTLAFSMWNIGRVQPCSLRIEQALQSTILYGTKLDDRQMKHNPSNHHAARKHVVFLLLPGQGTETEDKEKKALTGGGKDIDVPPVSRYYEFENHDSVSIYDIKLVLERIRKESER